MIIRKLRLDKGWSQEQLAEISGVSTRTIQRIERGKTASLESLKCLAAVFETEITTLREDPPMTNTQNPPLTDEDRAALAKMREWMHYDDDGHYVDPSLNSDERVALEYVRDIKSFYMNLLSYVVVMAGLLLINLLTDPSYIWAVWPALGWGLGLLMHGLTVFERFSFFGTEWERKQVEKRLRK